MAALCTLAGNSPRRGDRSLGRGRAHAVRPAVVWFRGARRARRPRLTPDPAQSDDPVSAHRRLSDRVAPARVDGRAGRGCSPSRERARAGLVLSIGLWQVLGVMPPPITTSAGPPVRWTATCSPSCRSRSRWRSGRYAACGSPFHWDGSSSRRWRSSRSRARATISSSCVRSGPWVRRRRRRSAARPARRRLRLGRLPPLRVWAGASHSLAHAEGRAVVGLLLRSRHRFGVCGGLKTTSRHRVIKKRHIPPGCSEPANLYLLHRGRTVASSTRGQGDPDAPGSRRAGDGVISLGAPTVVPAVTPATGTEPAGE